MNLGKELLGFWRVSGGRVIRHAVQPTVPENNIEREKREDT